MKSIELFLKRFFDISLSIIAIIILHIIPFLIIIPIIIKLSSKGPIIFKQERVGKDGKIFKVYKFRTMLIPEYRFDKYGNALSLNDSITKFGKFLRKTSLDELMQLYNILKGDMSIIGPRPTLPYQVERYSKEQRKRLLMRPGITGWAQVNGRNSLTWSKKIEYDIYYIKNFSLWFDIKIIFKTFKTVFKRENIEFNQHDELTNKNNVNIKKALVLCGGLPQIYLVKELKSHNYTVVLVDENDNVPAIEFADIYYPVSTLDVDGVRKIALEEKVDFIISVCADQMLLVAAQLSEELHLPCYIDYETARNVSSKEYMKKIFVEHHIPTSKYIIGSFLNKEDVKKLVFPLIVKPVDSYSSRGVKKVNNYDELLTAFESAVEISRSKTAIIEEFVNGYELSIDIYVENGKIRILNVCEIDKIPCRDDFIICRGNYPVSISTDLKKEIEFVSQKIAKAFNLKNTPMLIQLKVDNDKISIIEFCARTGGGIKFKMIKDVSGFDVIKAVVDLTLGEYPHVLSFENNDYIVNEFIYCKEGKLDHIEGFKELLSEGIIDDFYQFKPNGFRFSSIKKSGDRLAYFSIKDKDITSLKEKHKIANQRVKAFDSYGNDLILHEIINIDHRLKTMKM